MRIWLTGLLVLMALAGCAGTEGLAVGDPFQRGWDRMRETRHAEAEAE
jgi:hypothetical protein